MPKLTDQQDTDGQHDPYSNPAARDLLRQEGEAGQDTGLSSDADSSKKSTTDPANTASNIRATNAAEQSAPDVPNQFNWDNSTKGGSPKKNVRARLRGFARKRGSLFIIGGGFLGAGTLVTMFFSPALLLVQMSEVLNEKFNDQLAVLDKRSTLIMKKKLNTQVTKNICGTKITIKCKYRTISKNQTKRLTAAGLIPLNDDGAIEGRGKPKAFEFEGRRIEAGQLLNEARNSPALRSALRKGYNPRFAAWADANAYKMLSRFGIKKSSSVDPSGDKDKMRQQLAGVAKGDVEAFGNKKLQGRDADGNPVDDDKAVKFTSDDGTEYNNADEGRRINVLIQESIDRGGLANSISKTVLKTGVKSVLTSTALGAGAVDTLCTAWTLIRVAGFAAKVYQQRQLIRYAYEFQKQADMIKSGEGTAELSTFFNDILTTTNANGKAATDSLGYMWAAFGDTFRPNDLKINKAAYTEEEAEAVANSVELQNETSRFVNGQLVSTSLMADLAKKVDNGGKGVEGADETCKFVKSWKGQALIIGAALAGAFVAVFSGGTSIGLGAILNGAAGVTLSVMFALLQPKLIDMAKGEVIKGDENGVEAGNAIVSGSGAINAQASQTRGIPVQTKEDYVAYDNLSRQVAADYNEVDRYERSPFDPTSKNTFVGSIVASIIPYISNSRSAGRGVLNMASFVTSTTSSLISPRVGAEAMTIDEVSQCNDHEYEEFDLAADPFCNLRYGMSSEDMAIDPEEVVDYMVDGGYIAGDDDPTPVSGREYEEYIKVCIEREASIGDELSGLDGGTGGGGDDGKTCIDGNSGADEERNTMFRLFYIDTSVDDGMESDFGALRESDSTTGGTQFVIATLNVWGYSHSRDNYQQRMDASLANLQSNGTEIAGLQEFQKPQRAYLLEKAGATFDISPKTEDYSDHQGENSIIWNKSRFELVEEGTIPNLKYHDGTVLRIPWIILRDIATDQQFYILNTHDPAFPENAKARMENAEQYVKFIDSLKEKDGLPIFFTGDFNSGFSVRTEGNTTYQGDPENLTYCILTKNGTMNNTFDMQENRAVKCPNQGNDNAVDHIYVSPEVQLERYWKTTNRGADGNGSDAHDTHFADVIVPGAASSSGAGTSFILASYNQKRSLSAAQHEAAMNNMINKKMDVIGTQETSNPKYSRYKDYLGKHNYGVFPTALPQQVNQTCAGSQAIFYNKTKFNLVKGAFIDYPRYPYPAVDCGAGEVTTGGHNEPGLPNVWTHTPVVWLQDTATGQMVIIINTHGVANVALAGSIQPAKARYKSAQIYVQEITRLKQENPGVPIMFAGDFNEGTGVRTKGNLTYEGKNENLLYCMFAANGLMKNAEATALGKKTACPNPSIGGVDYIYHTPEVQVTNFTEIPRAQAASDHPAIYARMTIPGSGSAVSSGKVVWPVDEKWWKADRNDFLGAHPTYSGTFTSPSVNGVAVDIGNPPDGSPVYSMVDGTVKEVNLCGAGDGMIVESTFGGKNLQIAYGHGTNPRFKVGDTVKAGERILDLGAIGCKVSGGHLHVDMLYDKVHICPQDVFLALGSGQTPNFEKYKSTGKSPCRR